MSTGDPSYTLYGLTEEHALLRKSVRELAEDRSRRGRPRSTSGGVPVGRARGAQARDLLGLHVPEEYGGAGADRIAHSIVVEEIARVCASSSLIPAGNKLGTMGLILSGSRSSSRSSCRRSPRRGDVLVRAVRARGGQRRRRDEDARGARRRRRTS
jgi:alkylation response protein AidB-like acyl-CoA dehydrogenase